MGFEKVVLEKVANVMESDRYAEFYAGTLFVACDANEAEKIVNKLTTDLNTKIKVSRGGNEYAFDFVA